MEGCFESKGLKVNLGKTNVMVISGITKDGMSKSKVDPCDVYSFRVKANSVLCVQCSKWIHSRCAGVKGVTQMFSRNFTCRKCKGNFGEAVEHEEKLCDEVETVREFAYLGDRVSAGGVCEAVAVKTRYWWVKFRQFSELHGRRFPLELKGTVYKNYARPAIMYGCEAWCL